jgi:thiamine biosynthesis lipoprotein
MNKYPYILILLIILLTTTGVEAQTEHLVAGRTMGTTYHVRVVTDAAESVNGLREKIDRRLGEINQVFSTYIQDSEISRFNALKAAGEKFPVSDDFIQVMRVAGKIHQLSEGAWDGTVNPLVDLWGFGPTQRQPQKPPAAEIKARAQKIGFDRIRIAEPNFLVKILATVTLDLNSIAKGFAVDRSWWPPPGLKIIWLKSAVRFTPPAFVPTVKIGGWASIGPRKKRPLTRSIKRYR